VGGSTIGRILGVSDYGGPWSVLAQYRGAPDEDSPEKARGRLFERMTLDLYVETTGRRVYLPGEPWGCAGPVIVSKETDGKARLRDVVSAPVAAPEGGPERQHSASVRLQETDHTERDARNPQEGVDQHHRVPALQSDLALGQELAWACCSPDGWVHDGTWGLLEAKTTQLPGQWGESGHYDYAGAADVMPASVVLQVAWSLLVTGLPWCDVVCLLPWYDIRTYRIYADADLQADLFAQVAEWRQHHLIEGRPLPVDASPACRAAVEVPSNGIVREATKEEWCAIRCWAAAQQARKSWEKTEAIARNDTLRLMGPADRLWTFDGYRVTRSNGLRLWEPREESE
jgi:hypothetical protein